MELVGNFQLVAEKFLQSDASIIELTNSFTNLVTEAKQKGEVLVDDDRTTHIDILLECIHKYLYCIIEYAEGGSSLTRSATLRQLCNKICTAVDQLKIKHEFVKNLSHLTFEFLFGQPSWIAKEILRMYSTILQFSDRAVRSEVIQDKGPYYLGRLMDELPFGDFEFQLIIVEILFRICTKEVLNNMLSMNFLTEDLKEAFYKINTDEFDLTARCFLNLLNEAEKYVFSFLCNEVTFDEYQLQEPPELTSFKGLWVDFNVRAATVTLFINNESFNEDSKWEMITIFPENIAKVDVAYAFNEEKRKKEGVAKFTMKGPCQLCYAPAQHKLLACRSLTLHSLDTEKFRETFNQAFPKIHKKAKQKQPTTLTHKRGYKPLDIVSVKSCATNHSTTFNVTIDSSLAGKRHKSKSVGGKSVTFADSTIITNSTKSKTISSRKSLNISLNQSLLLELEEKSEDISLLSYKIKNLETSGSKMKRFVNFDDLSLSSNLSVLEHVETGKDAERAVASKKLKLSSLDKCGKSEEKRFSEYNKEFLSNLIDIEENSDDIGGHSVKTNKNLVWAGSVGPTKSKLLKTEADSTTSISGLYGSNLLMQEKESDQFHSIEDIYEKNSERYKKTEKISRLKQSKAGGETRLNLKTFKITKVTSSSLDKSMSGLSLDEVIDLKEKREELRKSKTKNKLEEKNKVIGKDKEMGSSLGVLLSPDLFVLSSQDSGAENVNKKEMKPVTVKKDLSASCISQDVLVSSLIHSTHDHLKKTRLEAKKFLIKKYPNDENSREPLMENSFKTNRIDNSQSQKKFKLKPSKGNFKGSSILRNISASSLIDVARDCNLDEFDNLKLERPKNLSQYLKDENPQEPELIEIPMPKTQNPFSVQTEMFETALTHLSIQESQSIPSTGRDLELFIDISQENVCYKGSSDENSQEANFNSNKEFKSKIQVLSNIQIQPPLSKPRKNLSFVSQDKGSTSTEEKERMKISDERISSTQPTNSPHATRAPTPDEESSNSNENIQNSAKFQTQNLNNENVEVSETQITSNSNCSSETRLSNENRSVGAVEEFESDTEKNKKVSEMEVVPETPEEKVPEDEGIKKKIFSEEGEKTMQKSIEKVEVAAEEVESNAGQEAEDKKKNTNEILIETIDESEKISPDCVSSGEKLNSEKSEVAPNTEIHRTKEITVVKKKRKKRNPLDVPQSPKHKSNKKTEQKKSNRKPAKLVQDNQLSNMMEEDDDNISLSELKRKILVKTVQKKSEDILGDIDRDILSQKQRNKKDVKKIDISKKKLNNRENKQQNIDERKAKDCEVLGVIRLSQSRFSEKVNNKDKLELDAKDQFKIPKQFQTNSKLFELPIDSNSPQNKSKTYVKDEKSEEKQSREHHISNGENRNVEVPQKCDIREKYRITQEIIEIIGKDCTAKTLPGGNKEDETGKPTMKELASNKNIKLQTQISKQLDKNMLEKSTNINIENKISQNDNDKVKKDIHLERKSSDTSKDVGRSITETNNDKRNKVTTAIKRPNDDELTSNKLKRVLTSKQNNENEKTRQNENKKISQKSEEISPSRRGDDDDDDEIPLSELKNKICRKFEKISNKKEEKDDKDDILLCELKRSIDRKQENDTKKTDTKTSKMVQQSAQQKTDVQKSDEIPLTQLKRSVDRKQDYDITKTTKIAQQIAQQETDEQKSKEVFDEIPLKKQKNDITKIKTKTTRIVKQNDRKQDYDITKTTKIAQQIEQQETDKQKSEEVFDKTPLKKQENDITKTTKIVQQNALHKTDIQKSEELFDEIPPKQLKRSVDRKQDNDITKIPKIAQQNAQQETDIKKSEELFDEIPLKQLKRSVDRKQDDDITKSPKMVEQNAEQESDIQKSEEVSDEIPLKQLKRSLIRKQENDITKTKTPKIVQQDAQQKTLIQKSEEVLDEIPLKQLKKSMDKKQENDITKTKTKLLKNAQQETDKETSVEVFDEVERSLCLLFDMDDNEPIEKPINSPPKKILPDTDKFANLTANSIIASSAGMLKRGRKLFSHENEEENFMNFTLVQEKIREVEESKQPETLSNYREKKQDKETRNSVKIDKNTKSMQKTTKSHAKSHRSNKKEITSINRTRPKRLDAFYDRVIDKLKTKNSSRTSHSVIPKVRRSENDRDGKYNLDFSLLKASFQKKQETSRPTLKFSSGQIGNRDFFTPEHNPKERNMEEENMISEFGERNAISGNQQDETDEILKVIMKNLALLCQKIANGTLKKPSPSIQKNLLAAAALLTDL